MLLRESYYSPEYDALDCIFVNQDLYAVVYMYDVHDNIVLTNDTNSWYELFTFEFELGSQFTAYHCVNYTTEEQSPWYRHTNMTRYDSHHYSNFTVVCPIRPLVQSYTGQYLRYKYTDERPDIARQENNIEVKPYLVRDIDVNNADHWAARYFNIGWNCSYINDDISNEREPCS